MRNWLPIIILAYLLSCTSATDKEGTHMLEKTVERQNLVIDSLKNIVKSKTTNNLAKKEKSSYVSFPSTAKLYSKIEATEVKDFEFAEVLSIAEADTAFFSEDYGVRTYLVCNGPPDSDIDECNCSHYAYITTGTYDLPNEYRLFKVGPFFMPKFSKWGGTKLQPELTLLHQVKGKTKATVIRILDFEKITLGNRVASRG